MTLAERGLAGPSIGTDRPRGGILGLLPELQRDPVGLLTRCTRDYGDVVRIREVRPLSKLKRWSLEEIVRRSSLAQLDEKTPVEDAQ